MKITKDLKLAAPFLNVDSKEEFEEIYTYGVKSFYKMLKSYTNVPRSKEFAHDIVSQALLKATLEYNPDEAKFTTFFYTKIRGEISIYLEKKKSTQNVFSRVAKEEGYSTKIKDIADGEGGVSVELEKIEEETPESILIKAEEENRLIAANKMAFSELPMELQNILYGYLSVGKIKTLAEMFSKSEKEISELTSSGLSLMFAKVLKSKHLNTEDKDDLKKSFNLI